MACSGDQETNKCACIGHDCIHQQPRTMVSFPVPESLGMRLYMTWQIHDVYACVCAYEPAVTLLPATQQDVEVLGLKIGQTGNLAIYYVCIRNTRSSTLVVAALSVWLCIAIYSTSADKLGNARHYGGKRRSHSIKSTSKDPSSYLAFFSTLQYEKRGRTYSMPNLSCR